MDTRRFVRFQKLLSGSNQSLIDNRDFEQRPHHQCKEPIMGKVVRCFFASRAFVEFKDPETLPCDRISQHGLLECKTCSRLWDRDTCVSTMLNVSQSTNTDASRPLKVNVPEHVSHCSVGIAQPVFL
eukprot:scaffold649_cov347-Pavlova_lutheri.AAC.100